MRGAKGRRKGGVTGSAFLTARRQPLARLRLDRWGDRHQARTRVRTLLVELGGQHSNFLLPDPVPRLRQLLAKA